MAVGIAIAIFAAIEYGLIAGSLSILIIAGVTGIGTTVKGTFNAVANALQ